MLKCQAIIDAMERIAPKKLAESWDNPGLLVGNPANDIHRILVCLDARDEVIDEAIDRHCELIIAHHPFIFHSMKKIRMDQPVGRMIEKLIKNDIAVMAAHTNLDIAEGGVNDVLAEKIGIDMTTLSPLDVTMTHELVKLAVYVPLDYADAVRDAIVRADAGHIGAYSGCTFSVKGEGTFIPGEGTHPFIGMTGKMEHVNEIRIETIFPVEIERNVIRAMLSAHPYEEPAYDLYPMRNEGKKESLGRVGNLKKPMKIDDFSESVRANLNAPYVRVVRANNREMIKKVGLCSGSGAEFIDRANISGCDVYVTGDVRYHEAQRARELNINVIDAGHFATEYPIVPVLANRLRDELKNYKGSVEIIVDESAKDFFEIVKI